MVYRQNFRNVESFDLEASSMAPILGKVKNVSADKAEEMLQLQQGR